MKNNHKTFKVWYLKSYDGGTYLLTDKELPIELELIYHKWLKLYQDQMILEEDIDDFLNKYYAITFI
jgi:hypothetical protein